MKGRSFDPFEVLANCLKLNRFLNFKWNILVSFTCQMYFWYPCFPCSNTKKLRWKPNVSETLVRFVWTSGPGWTMKHCCGNIWEFWCVLECSCAWPPMEILLRKQNLVPVRQKCSSVSFETFSSRPRFLFRRKCFFICSPDKQYCLVLRRRCWHWIYPARECFSHVSSFSHVLETL